MGRLWGFAGLCQFQRFYSLLLPQVSIRQTLAVAPIARLNASIERIAGSCVAVFPALQLEFMVNATV